MGDKNPSGTQFLKVMHKGNSANHILTFPDMIKNVYFSVYLEERYEDSGNNLRSLST